MRKIDIHNNTQRGFTLVEMLVVVTVIVMLIFLGLRELWGSTGNARDVERLQMMEELEIAIRLYFEDNGRYPDTCPLTGGQVRGGPGPVSAGWGAECDEWIVGLVPKYLPELPEDPSSEDENSRGFFYEPMLNNTEFKLFLFGTVEKKLVESSDHPYARCAASCTFNYCTNALGRATYAFTSGKSEFSQCR